MKEIDAITIVRQAQEYTLKANVEGYMSQANYDAGFDTHNMHVRWDSQRNMYKLAATFKTTVTADNTEGAVKKAIEKFKALKFEGFSSVIYSPFKVIDVRDVSEINPNQMDVAEIDTGDSYIQECYTVLDENGMHVEVALGIAAAELQKIIDRVMTDSKYEPSHIRPDVYLHVTQESLKMFLSTGIQTNGILSFIKQEVPLSDKEKADLISFANYKVQGLNEMLSDTKVRSVELPIDKLSVHTETKDGVSQQSVKIVENYGEPAFIDFQLDCPKEEMEKFLTRAGGMFTAKNNVLHGTALSREIMYLEFQGTKGETASVPLKDSERATFIQKVLSEIKNFDSLLSVATETDKKKQEELEKEAEKFTTQT